MKSPHERIPTNYRPPERLNMSQQQREREIVATQIKAALRAISVADDEFAEPHDGDLDLVRKLVQKCHDHCTNLLRLIPPELT